MGRTDSTTIVAGTPAFGTKPVPAPGDALHEATLDFLATEDAGEIAGKLLAAASRIIPVDGSSIWVPVDDSVQCRGAIGERRCDLATHLRDEREIASTLGGGLLACRKPRRSRDRGAGCFRQPSKDFSLGFIESAVPCERTGDADVGGDVAVDYKRHGGDGAVVLVV